MAEPSSRAPEASLISLDLENLSCSKGSDFPDKMKGKIVINNKISIESYNENEKDFKVSLVTEIKGIAGDDELEPIFQADSSWVGTFQLKRKVKLSTLEKYSDYYSLEMYPLARMTLLDALIKMGFNLSAIPWVPNPK
jgi:hypothetical protein